MKKKYLLFIVVAIVLLILVKNRASEKDIVNIRTYENIKDLYKDDYESNDGIMYENLSDYFDYRIYPIEIVLGNQGSEIVYHITVFNKSDSDFENARVILSLHDDMYRYIASEVLEYPMGAIDLFSINSPKKQITNKFAHALDSTFKLLLKEGLDRNIIYHDDYFVKIAGEINIMVQWDGGSESKDFKIHFQE